MALLRADLATADPATVAHVANLLFTGVGDEQDFFSAIRVDVPSGHVQMVDRPLRMFLHAFSLVATALRRDVFAELGGFDLSFRTDEDTDMGHRMAARGPFIVRGDVVTEAIRRPGDVDALSQLRRRDKVHANELKQRLFRAILARSDDSEDPNLAAAALSSMLLQRAGLIRAAGQGGYWPLMWQSVRTHPSVFKGIVRAGQAIVTGHAPRRGGVDRTAEG
jgi:hypothetical protein